MAKLEQKARERGWTVMYRLSDNDIGVTRKDPTRPGKYRPGYEEAMRLVDARAVDAAAINGKRFLGGPRPFGYREDHVTAHPAEGPAVAEACAALLGGGTVSGVMREWTRLELTPPQRDRRGTTRRNPGQHPEHPAEPADRRTVGPRG